MQMEDTAYRAIAIVGAGAVLPDAPNVTTFWNNVKSGRYSITEVTPDRWDPAFYYDADPKPPRQDLFEDRRLGARFTWDPMKWHMPIPPRVTDAMDQAQKWAIAATREALEDYGYPKRPLNPDRVAVILGNAMAGEKHYLTALRVFFPEYAHELAEIASFAALPEDDSRRNHARTARPDRQAPARNYRRQHARRTGQLHCRTHRQHLQLPRPEFYLRRGLRLRHGGDDAPPSKDWSPTISTLSSPAASTATWAPRPS